MSWSLSIAAQPAQGCKDILGHRRALGPPSLRDRQTHHLLEDNILVTSPRPYLRVLWTTHTGLESLQLHTDRGESYFRSGVL